MSGISANKNIKGIFQYRQSYHRRCLQPKGNPGGFMLFSFKQHRLPRSQERIAFNGEIVDQAKDGFMPPAAGPIQAAHFGGAEDLNYRFDLYKKERRLASQPGFLQDEVDFPYEGDEDEDPDADFILETTGNVAGPTAFEQMAPYGGLNTRHRKAEIEALRLQAELDAKLEEDELAA